MTQLSRPYQIALAALALFVLVWFAALHGRRSNSGGGSGSSPSASSAPAAPSAAAQARAAAAPTHVYTGPAPGVEGLTRGINKAHGAVAQSQRDAHRAETSDPSSATPAPDAPVASASHAAAHAPAASSTAHTHRSPVPAHRGTATHPAAAVKPRVQGIVERELRGHKTVLILFWNHHGSDDMAVHNALPAVQHALGGTVAVHYATAGRVGAFGTITHAIQVTQTPTLLIVNPHGQTTVLTGLNDAFAIQQAVRESRHSS